MSERIKRYLAEQFGPNWQEKFDSQEREFMVEVLYCNNMISLNGVFDLGWWLGYKAHETEVKATEVLPRI